MSRIGKKPVKVPSGVKVAVTGNTIAVEGKLGKLEWNFRREVNVDVDGGRSARSAAKCESRQARALHGLSRAMIQNMMKGVTDGYEKKLEIVGVGYLAAIQRASCSCASASPTKFRRRFPPA